MPKVNITTLFFKYILIWKTLSFVITGSSDLERKLKRLSVFLLCSKKPKQVKPMSTFCGPLSSKH